MPVFVHGMLVAALKRKKQSGGVRGGKPDVEESWVFAHVYMSLLIRIGKDVA